MATQWAAVHHSIVTNCDLCNEVKLEFGALERNPDLRNEVKLEFGTLEHDPDLRNEVKLALHVERPW